MRIVVVTDTHYSVHPGTSDSTLWNRQILTQSRKLGSALTKQLGEIKPDLVIHCGDLTHDGDLESLSYCRDVFAGLKFPVHFTLGNHDTALPHAREEIARIFGLSEATFSYRVDFKDFSLLFLDTNFAHLHDGSESPLMDWRRASAEYVGVGPTRQSLEWLDRQLADLRGRPVVLIAHHPFLTKDRYPRIIPREITHWQERIGPVDHRLFPMLVDELRSTVVKHQGTIRVVFTGHWHINDLHVLNGISFVQTGSLIENPFEFRVFEYSHGLLRGAVEKLSVPSLDLEGLSNVPEWGNSWTGGLESDRQVRILL